MKSILRRLYRERRRLVIFATAAMLSGYLWFQGEPTQAFGLPRSVWMAIAFGFGLTFPAALMTLIAPSYRFALETVGISVLIYSIVMVRVPGYSFLAETAGLAPFVAFLVLSNLIHLFFYGEWSERWMKFRRSSERSTAHTSIDRESAWKMLLPTVNRELPYWDNTVQSFTHVDGQPGEAGDTVRLGHVFPDGKRMTQQIRIDHVNPGQSIRYHYSVPDATNGAQNERTCAFALEEHDGELLVHVRWDRADYPIRRALMHWVDDWAGRSLDIKINQVEKLASDRREEALRIAPLTRRRDGKSGL